MIRPIRTRSQVAWVTALSALALMLAGCLAAVAGLQAWYELHPPGMRLAVKACFSVNNSRMTFAMSPLIWQPSANTNCLLLPWFPRVDPPTIRVDFPP